MIDKLNIVLVTSACTIVALAVLLLVCEVLYAVLSWLT